VLRPLFVVILNIWPEEPVYHKEADWQGPRNVTACGRPVAYWKPWLPHKHVVKFARPCKGCFPAQEATDG
jgi:hypothetical protein